MHIFFNLSIKFQKIEMVFILQTNHTHQAKHSNPSKAKHSNPSKAKQNKAEQKKQRKKLKSSSQFKKKQYTKWSLLMSRPVVLKLH